MLVVRNLYGSPPAPLMEVTVRYATTSGGGAAEDMDLDVGGPPTGRDGREDQQSMAGAAAPIASVAQLSMNGGPDAVQHSSRGEKLASFCASALGLLSSHGRKRTRVCSWTLPLLYLLRIWRFVNGPSMCPSPERVNHHSVFVAAEAGSPSSSGFDDASHGAAAAFVALAASARCGDSDEAGRAECFELLAASFSVGCASA